MPKWLLWVLLIIILTIEATHFISPGALPNWLVIPIVMGVIAVIAIYIRLGRQKELDQIRDQLQKLQQEIKELREKQLR